MGMNGGNFPMNKLNILIGGAVAAIMALGVGAAQAQVGYGQWRQHYAVSGVVVDYAYRVSGDELRVVWRCTNNTNADVSCSVGGGGTKEYQCWNGNTTLGSTHMPGERATARAGSSYTFPADWACRGLGATSVEPIVRISIER